jgi:phage FluMu gp28-like protein
MTEQIEYIHLPYQSDFLGDDSDVKIMEKSRRIGISWAMAHYSALLAAEIEGNDTFYIGYNKDMAREFIEDAAAFAKTLDESLRVFELEEDVFRDIDKDINVYRLKFASGNKVEALSSRPSNLRGHKAGVRIIIDEAAFHDDLPGLLKAALAHLIWGGKVAIISSHNGDDNPFNVLIKLVKAGKLPYSVHRVTLDDALAQGLYKRICAVIGREWTPEGEKAWRDDLIKKYGDGANEELFCIPSKSGSRYFTRALVENCMTPDIPIYRYKCSDEFTFLSDYERETATRKWLLENVIIPKTAESVFIGEDFGRSGDLSVLAPFARTKTMNLRSLFIIEMRNVPFAQQEQVNYFVADAFSSFRGAAYDARGNGQYLAEKMAQKYGASRVHHVMLSREWYRDNMPKHKARFEDKTITLPLNEDILDDYRTVGLKDGVPVIMERTGDEANKRHGDAVIACALADFAERNDDNDCLEPGDVMSAQAADRGERIPYHAY